VAVITSGAVFPVVSDTVKLPVDGRVEHFAVAVKFMPSGLFTVIHDAGDGTTVNVPVYAGVAFSLIANVSELPCADGRPVLPAIENDV
jgi:hypothetical protein